MSGEMYAEAMDAEDSHAEVDTMVRNHRERIRRNFKHLVADLSDSLLAKILDAFFQRGIIDQNTRAAIERPRTEEGRSREFLHMMVEPDALKKEKIAFDTFFEVLEINASGHVKEMLMNTDLSEDTEDQNSERRASGGPGAHNDTRESGAGPHMGSGDNRDRGQAGGGRTFNISDSHHFHIGNVYNIGK